MNLDAPGTYLHWSFIDISVANLTVIAVMILVFGAALLIRFPHKGGDLPPEEYGEEQTAAAAAPAPGDEDMWTAKARVAVAKVLPPKKLLPDRQPAYVASWIYVFGVATLVAMAIAIASGIAITLGGPDWWHTNPVGHFFNSLHLWSVELFMAFMVIHLWGKFWMAAWRGRRWATWITGVLAFMASVVVAFTGYLSQQNFDSQWIATNGKDAFNAVGVGALWNPMNFGQMLMWHIVLMPVVLVAIAGAHVLLVRVRGVSHPLPERAVRGRQARRASAIADRAAWKGPNRRYDILKEGSIATAIVGIIVLVMAGVLSSPDVPPLSIQTWAKVAPADFVATAATELDGSALAASYGPPYNNGTAAVQQVGPINLQNLFGVTQPINGARDYVLSPLSKLALTDTDVAGPLRQFNSASAAQQQKWASAYTANITKLTIVNGQPVMPKGNYGPVPELITNELEIARSGALDADLLADHSFFGTDYTKPLLFIADGGYYADQATAMHLTGNQWGVMNETGSYPGQPWLWLYQAWYHIAPFSHSSSVDVWAVELTGLCTLALALIPFIPGLRDIPRVVPVYKLIWRSWYRDPASKEIAAAEAKITEESPAKA